jgi:hypothetical protein
MQHMQELEKKTNKNFEFENPSKTCHLGNLVADAKTIITKVRVKICDDVD